MYHKWCDFLFKYLFNITNKRCQIVFLVLAVACCYDYSNVQRQDSGLLQSCKDSEQISSLLTRQRWTYHSTPKFITSHHTTKTTFVLLLELGNLLQNILSFVNNSNGATRRDVWLKHFFSIILHIIINIFKHNLVKAYIKFNTGTFLHKRTTQQNS